MSLIKLAQAGVLQTCIWGVSSLVCSQDTDYYDRFFCILPCAFQVNARIVLLPSTSQFVVV
jgi:hypothetical protein